MRSVFGWPSQDPIVFEITGSVYLAFGILSVLGLRSPLKFVPILLLKLTYKLVWFIGVILPMMVSGEFPTYELLSVIIFATYVIGGLVAIPFSYIFSDESYQEATSLR